MSHPAVIASGQPVGVKRRESGIDPLESGILLDLLTTYMMEVGVYLDIDMSKDIAYVESRTIEEGFAFISRTLPEFLDWFRSCLRVERFRPCPGFKTFRTKTWDFKYPAFLSGLMEYMSDEHADYIYASTPEFKEAQRFAHTAISTICQSFGKKYEVPHPEEFRDRQIVDSILLDQNETFDYNDYIDVLSDDQLSKVCDHATAILSDLFAPYTDLTVHEDERTHRKVWGPEVRTLNLFEHVPRHGSGAVAVPCLPHEKYTKFMGVPPDLMAIDQFEDLLYNPGEIRNSRTPLCGRTQEFLDLLGGGVGRLSSVPKDSKSVRIIGLPMKEFMFFQQMVRLALYEWVERHPRTRGFVNFTDQSINGRMALKSSLNGRHATFDLRRASDSVTRVHVDNMWPHDVSRVLNALRSRQTRVSVCSEVVSGVKGGHEVLLVDNNKYAPMGSALCFPVEAVTFWALALATIECSDRVVPERQPLARSDVWVYGDDMIFPAEYADEIERTFGAFGFKINLDKSFSTGPFRESCGVDACDGSNVTPCTRLSTRLPIRELGLTDSAKAKSIVAWVEYANSFEKAGFPAVSKKIRQTVTQLHPSAKSFPRLKSEYNSGGLYFLDYDGWPVSKFLGSMCSKESKRVDKYSYRPYFSKHPCRLQGELFTYVTPNYFQGVVKRTWSAEETSYRSDISENERRLRYYSEGSTELPGNWFTDAKTFALKRKFCIMS